MSNEAGKMLYDDFKSGELPDRVEINGRFVVSRTQIASIDLVPDKAETYQLSKTELLQFGEKIKPYLNESGGLDEDGKLRFLEAEKLVRVERFAPRVVVQSDARVHINPDLIPHYQKTIDKINQWQAINGKREFAKKMQVRAHEKTAATL